MESLLQCPSCGARTRPADDWCAVCYARLSVPAPRTAESVAAPPPTTASQPHGPADRLNDPGAVPGTGLEADPSDAPVPGSRRARRAEQDQQLDQLADAMLIELAAAQPRVTLPGPMERLFGAIGLTQGETKGRKALGIAVVTGGLVAVLVTLSAVAGLLL